ncbi:MAG: hypothetical protein HY908_22625 [Myxococcales bacterium]|nr:hypothetical protein [Myxococcales bacterium]
MSQTRATIGLSCLLVVACGKGGGSGPASSSDKPKTDDNKATAATEAALGVVESASNAIFFGRNGFNVIDKNAPDCEAVKKAFKEELASQAEMAKLEPAPGLAACIPAVKAAYDKVATIAKGATTGTCDDAIGAFRGWDIDSGDQRKAYCAFAVAARACGEAGKAAGATRNVNELDSTCK